MGGGLVLFGIGGDVSGGLVDAITERRRWRRRRHRAARIRERKALARTQANPQDAPAWATLARARYNLASAGDNFDREGQLLGRRAARSSRPATAWERTRARRRSPTTASRASWCRPSARSTSWPRRPRRRRSSPSRNRRGDVRPARAPRLPGGPDPQGRPRPPTRRSSSPSRTCARRAGQLEAAKQALGQSGGRPAAQSQRHPVRVRRYTRPPRPCSSTGRAADS